MSKFGLLSDKLWERFWSKVNKAGPVPDLHPELGPCWIWTANKNRQGYGLFWITRVNYLKAHRVSFEEAFGPCPEGLEPDHLCRVRACVHPNHMEAVTKVENTMRGFSPPAINARKTHCVHGHPFSGSNLKIRRRGISDQRPARRCIACEKEFSRQRVKREREDRERIKSIS